MKMRKNLFLGWCAGLMLVACATSEPLQEAPKIEMIQSSALGGEEKIGIRLLRQKGTGCEYQVSTGTKPSGGYSVESVSWSGNKLMVKVKRPPKGQMTIQMLTSPMAVVRIDPCPKQIPELIEK